MVKKSIPQWKKDQEFAKKHSPEVAAKKLKKMYKKDPSLKGRKFRTIIGD